MPVLNLNKVVILGSGALSIGQAGEFDYSGSQALKALEEEGIQTILINPNIATVQTSTSDKRKIYLYPVEPHWVEKVFQLEKPDAIIAGFGGQTALNCVLKLEEQGILDKYGVKNLGTCIDSLRLTEDRNLFAREMEKIAIPIPPSTAVNSLDEAIIAGEKIGYPVIIRAAYALGGLGSGFANNEEELVNIVGTALNFSPQVLIEKSLKGWREIEYEVMRDGSGSVITICNMENIDPLGIHTGDSIVIAPSQTLNDDEFQSLRNYAIKIVNALKIHGECNVQYALSPYSNEFYVIEVNARLSRSSALASKATGYPIAYIAAKVVIGYELIELDNPVTGKTRAFFEPAMDYVVVKIPRWDLSKFTGTSRRLGSSMKSVGEVMAIGRNFAEALQKAARMASENPNGLSERPFKKETEAELLEEIKNPTDQRMMAVAEAFRRGIDMLTIHDESKIDKWFLRKIEEIILMETEIIGQIRRCFVNVGHSKDVLSIVEKTFMQVDKATWIKWKKFGFSDHQIISLASDVITGLYKPHIKKAALVVRKARISKEVLPVVKKIDTSAGEFPAESNYLYMTYEGVTNDTQPFVNEKPILVLGSGAYRIGSSVEFDWCAVMCSEFLRKNNLKSIVINCNPETVSTDFNTSDKLYFEELSVERILDIYECEKALGVVTSMGGQVPNNHTDMLAYAGLNILGHSAATIENAESREKFSALLDSVGVEQPRWKAVSTQEELSRFIEKVGFPILVRPSFVLSGTAMKVAYNREALNDFLSNAALVSPEYPVVATEFLQDNREIELDGVACEGRILISFMTEHLENAGIHSGDSTLVYPAQKLYVETVRQVKQAGVLIAKELKLNGPFNIQFLAESNKVKVIECNARASRSFPFISKVTGINLAEIATRVITKSIVDTGPINALYFDEFNLPYVGVKAPMFSFARVEGYDPVLGVEMTSTGEVGCLGNDFEEALLLSLEATGVRVPKKGMLVSSGRLHEKVKFLESVALLHKFNVPIYATVGTAKFLKENGYDVIEATDAVSVIEQGKVDLVINVPKNLELQELQHGALIRRAAIRHGLSLITTIEMTVAFSKSLEQYQAFLRDHKPIVLPKMNV